MTPDAVDMQRAVEEWQRARDYLGRPCLKCGFMPAHLEDVGPAHHMPHASGLVIGPLGLCSWPLPAAQTFFDSASCLGAFGEWLKGRRPGALNSRWDQCLRMTPVYRHDYGPEWAKLRLELVVDDDALRVALDEWLALS